MLDSFQEPELRTLHVASIAGRTVELTHVFALELVEALADELNLRANATAHPHSTLHELLLIGGVLGFEVGQPLILVLERGDFRFKLAALSLHLGYELQRVFY